METSKSIDREHSLSFEGVGRYYGPKFPCVS